MRTTELHELQDPDLFACELQHWLLTEGPRSSSVRRLMRVAKRAPGAELERIFETKLGEFRRYQRESRVPTLWNAPVRLGEVLWDQTRFAPPRDVVMTLVYVLLALGGLEAGKQYLHDQSPRGQYAGLSQWDLDDPFLHGGDPFFNPTNSLLSRRQPAAEGSPATVSEFAQQLAQALESEPVRRALLAELAAAVRSNEIRAAILEETGRVLAAPMPAPGDDSLPRVPDLVEGIKGDAHDAIPAADATTSGFDQ